MFTSGKINVLPVVVLQAQLHVFVWAWKKPSGNICHFFVDTAKIMEEQMKNK